ncbi:MAG: putative PEP-binding protein [Clostridia bacterium]
MAWADKYRKLKVRTNADTPADAKKARELGAEGIGLCRTEHMFFEEDRIAAFREMICSDTVEERSSTGEDSALSAERLLQLYEALEGNPVTIRFLIRLCMSSFLPRKLTLRSWLRHRARA